MDYIHQTMPPNTCLINGGCDWEYFDRCDRVYAISRIVVVKIAGLIDFAQLCNRTICAASKTIRLPNGRCANQQFENLDQPREIQRWDNSTAVRPDMGSA